MFAIRIRSRFVCRGGCPHPPGGLQAAYAARVDEGIDPYARAGGIFAGADAFCSSPLLCLVEILVYHNHPTGKSNIL